MPELTGTAGILLMFFLIYLAVLWILLPFAVFKIKKVVIDILAELQGVNTSKPDYNKLNNQD